jgi:hypothetical protein
MPAFLPLLRLRHVTTVEYGLLTRLPDHSAVQKLIMSGALCLHRLHLFESYTLALVTMVQQPKVHLISILVTPSDR